MSFFLLFFSFYKFIQIKKNRKKNWLSLNHIKNTVILIAVCGLMVKCDYRLYNKN
jgi:hypothetical protein